MPSSQFEDEIDDGYEESDDTVPMPEIKQEPEYPGSPIATSPKSVNSLSLADAQELIAALSAIALKFGNNDKGVIATLNTLLKRSEVLDKEQKEQIVPLLGELKALLATSQEELKNFNSQAQKNLETQIKEVIGNVDFSPIQSKVEAANVQILESTNALQTKAKEIEELANRVKKFSFFQTLKWLIAGGVVGTVLMYGFFSYREAGIAQKLKAEFDAKIQSIEARTSVFSKLKSDDWNALIVDNQGVKNLQIVVRDTTSQANCGRVFNTDPNGKKYQVSFFNIPIYK